MIEINKVGTCVLMVLIFLFVDRFFIIIFPFKSFVKSKSNKILNIMILFYDFITFDSANFNSVYT